MMKNATFVFLFMLNLMVLLLVSGEDVFDYSNGPKGPAHWGELKPEWSSCKFGNSQSPINIIFDELQPVCALRLLQARYNATKAALVSTDHDIALEFPENAGTLIIDGTSYRLSEYHIHAPSEHSFNGRKFDVEGHLVHKSSSGKIAVVSVVYKVGKVDDIFIDQVEHLLPAMKNNTQTVDFVDPSKLGVSGKRFYTYKGSLTTPPCTEEVIWNILRRPRTLSHKQYELLMDVLKGPTDRPLQGLNGRQVMYHK